MPGLCEHHTQHNAQCGYVEEQKAHACNAKYEIYQLINQLVKDGKSVIMISSEMPEVLHMSDRIIVVHEGDYKGELSGDEMTAENVMRLAILQKKEGAHEK